MRTTGSIQAYSLLKRINFQLALRGLNLNQLSEQLGYTRREVSDFLYSDRYATINDFLAQDLMSWLDGMEQVTGLTVIPVLTSEQLVEAWGSYESRTI